jgi:hypothetical protein
VLADFALASEWMFAPELKSGAVISLLEDSVPAPVGSKEMADQAHRRAVSWLDGVPQAADQRELWLTDRH